MTFRVISLLSNRGKALLCHSNVSAQECPFFWTLLALVTINQIHSRWNQISSTACSKESLVLTHLKSCTWRTSCYTAAPLTVPTGLDSHFFHEFYTTVMLIIYCSHFRSKISTELVHLTQLSFSFL